MEETEKRKRGRPRTRDYQPKGQQPTKKEIPPELDGLNTNQKDKIKSVVDYVELDTIMELVFSPKKYGCLYKMPIEEMKRRIIRYLNYCFKVVTDENGIDTVKRVNMPTWNGLALFLQTDRKTLRRYAMGAYEDSYGVREYNEGKQHVEIIQNFKVFMTKCYEEELTLNPKNAGTIFWLLNADDDFVNNDHKTLTVEVKPTKSIEELERMVLPEPINAEQIATIETDYEKDDENDC